MTLAAPGDVGGERAGTTLRPAWLKVRGLELEREVRMWLHRADDGSIELHETRDGSVDYWLKYVRHGEPVLVFDDDTDQVVAHASVTPQGIRLDRSPPETTVLVVLLRVRGIESCALDAIKRRGAAMSNEEVGDAVGRHRTLVARENLKALEKACRRAVEMGMTRGDFAEALRQMGAMR
jgi:hypothetical protein